MQADRQADRPVSLFSYGMLMWPDVMHALTGQRFESREARLDAHVRLCVAGADYPGVVPRRGAATEGRLYDAVDAESLALLDEFEGEMYERVELAVRVVGRPEATAARAQVYRVCPANRVLITPITWQPERYERDRLRAAVAGCEEFRAEYLRESSISRTAP